MGLILALARGIVRSHEALRADPWPGWRTDLPPTLHPAPGSPAGPGRPGPHRARGGDARAGLRARGAWPMIPICPPAPRSSGRRSPRRRLREFLRQVDVVSIHAPLTAETRGLFGPATFRAMRRAALLVNAARGAIVDTDALADALGPGPSPAPPSTSCRRSRPGRREADRGLPGRRALAAGPARAHPPQRVAEPGQLPDCRRKAVETALGYLGEGGSATASTATSWPSPAEPDRAMALYTAASHRPRPWSSCSGAMALLFGMIYLIPGDPATIALGPPGHAGDDRRLPGPDGPRPAIPVQFWNFVSHVVRGDLGVDVWSERPVRRIIAEIAAPHRSS